MISPELLRRFHFSGGLSQEKIVELAKIGNKITVEAGHYFFRGDERVDKLYLIIEGEVAIVLEVPDREAKNPISEQLAGEITTKDIIVSMLGTGSTFGWAAVIPPNDAFNATKATQTCTVVSFDANDLQTLFDADPQFAYQMSMRAAQDLRERFRDLSIETLACIA